METWKPVKGLESLYEVSDLGRIKSLARTITIANKHGTTTSRNKPELILTLSKDKQGYLKTSLGTHRDNIKVHQLVALHFIGECPEGHEVNHVNFNKADNSIENLEYIPAKANRYYKQKFGTVWLDANHPTGTNSWRANCKYEGQYIYLGHYETETEAQAAVLGARALFDKTLNPYYKAR